MQELFTSIDFIAILVAIASILVIWQISWVLLKFSIYSGNKAFSRMGASRFSSNPPRILSRFSERHPRIHSFMANRFRTDSFSGLPLTLIIIAAVYVVILLGGLIEELIEAEELVIIDERINDLFNRLRTDTMIAIFRWITELGAFPALTASSLIATGYMWTSKRLSMIIALWITVIGSQSTTYLGKFGFGRDRPEFTTDLIVHTSSFPSGHATGSIAVYGFIAYSIARMLPTLRARFEVTYWIAVLILMIGLSRIFLSVHYISDVTAGYLVGAFWLMAGITTTELVSTKTRGQ